MDKENNKVEMKEDASSDLEATPKATTRYIDMLLQLDNIPQLHNILAGLFTWLLLAGYIVFPGTFTSLRNSKVLNNSASNTGKVIQRAVQNLPLLWVAAICCIAGGSGMSWLWWVWQRNYIWLLNRIIIPGLLNSSVGLLTTLINIYTAQGGLWSITAIVTAAVTGSSSTFMLLLFLIYDRWLLRRVKIAHELEMESRQSD